MQSVTEQIDAIAAHERAFDEVVDPARKGEMRRRMVEPFEPGGVMASLPADVKASALATIDATIDADLERSRGEALYAAEHTARRLEEQLDAYLGTAQEPPAPVQAFELRTGTRSLTLGESTNLEILDEHRRARFDRDFGTLSPSQALGAYQRALQEPHEQQNASFIRWFETKHRGTWGGAPIANDVKEAMAASSVQAAIKAARASRIPEDVKGALDTIRRIYAKADAARRAGVRSVRPAGWQ